MQNEELKQSQEELSDLYNKYHELYDELPIGYFTLNDKGIIKNVNNKGLELLALKKEWINKWFGIFIPKNERRKLHQHLTGTVISPSRIQSLH